MFSLSSRKRIFIEREKGVESLRLKSLEKRVLNQNIKKIGWFGEITSTLKWLH